MYVIVCIFNHIYTNFIGIILMSTHFLSTLSLGVAQVDRITCCALMDATSGVFGAWIRGLQALSLGRLVGKLYWWSDWWNHGFSSLKIRGSANVCHKNCENLSNSQEGAVRSNGCIHIPPKKGATEATNWVSQPGGRHLLLKHGERPWVFPS